MAGLVAALTGSVTTKALALLLARALAMIGLCALACVQPIARALRVHPMEVLRTEV